MTWVTDKCTKDYGASTTCGIQRSCSQSDSCVRSSRRSTTLSKAISTSSICCSRPKRRVTHSRIRDKLKPFGFAIHVHGAIDGYSRRILWLEVSQSNNDPKVVAQYFVDYMKTIGGTASRIRGDCGTENCIIARIHATFPASK